MTRTSNDPLRILEVLVGLVVVVMTLLAVATLAGTAFGSGSIPGVDAQVCVTRSGQDGFGRIDGESTGPAGLRDGITWSAREVQLCDPDADGVTRALAGAGLAVWVGGPMVFFALLWRVLRRARVQGVFADRVPVQLRRLGGVLLVWAALDFVLGGLVDAALLTRMTADDDVVFFTADVPWLLVLLGLAFLALAQVMDQAVDMRRDVEATI